MWVGSLCTVGGGWSSKCAIHLLSSSSYWGGEEFKGARREARRKDDVNMEADEVIHWNKTPSFVSFDAIRLRSVHTFQ